jgi:hypothetical protein
MMKYSILLAVLFFATLQYCNAQSDSTTEAARLIQIEQQLNDGLPGDSALWAKYLDPKWYIVDENGNGLNRKDFLQGFGPFQKMFQGI